MNDLSERDSERLVLGYEDLEPADRAVADRVLSRRPDLAARLRWHQEQEALARDGLPHELDLAGDDLSPAEVAAQLASLRRILAELDLPVNLDDEEAPAEAKVIDFPGHLRRHARWALPLAAVLALAMLLPHGDADKVWLQDLAVTRIELQFDGSRGPSEPLSTDGVLHSGQAFALDFALVEDAYVVIYHVDPAGRVSLAHPANPTIDPTRLAGGRRHQIPAPESGETWILGTETGTESFLVAISHEPPEDLDHLPTSSAPADRELVLRELRSRLESLVDQVELHEFRHVD